MAARILDGRALAAEVRADVATRAAALRERGVDPCLAIAIAGDDAAARGYVRSIESAGAKAGIDVRVHALGAAATEDEVRALLRRLDDDPGVHGIILQQPLPAHLAARRLAGAIAPRKDVDGASPASLGALASGGSAFAPATALACMLLLERSERSTLRGARACVVGRSSVVGLPVALMLIARDATVTVVHSRTRDLARATRDAEVLVVATGRPGTIAAGMVAPGATVIDVGTTYVDGKVTGDVACDEVSDVAGEITPVPGGVGPVTSAALLRNVVTAAESTAAREATS